MTAPAAVTFAVSEVTLGELRPALEIDAGVSSLLARRVEALHCAASRLVVCDTMHPLAKAAHDAFYEHLPVLEKLVQTASGAIDRDFWRSFFRYESGSGSAELTGWILTLFPYLIVNWQTNGLGPNPYLESWQRRYERAQSRRGFATWNDHEGPGLGSIPSGLVSAPVRCFDASTSMTHDLRFVAGMFGVEQHATTRALAPAFGWAIVYEDPS